MSTWCNDGGGGGLTWRNMIAETCWRKTEDSEGMQCLKAESVSYSDCEWFANSRCIPSPYEPTFVEAKENSSILTLPSIFFLHFSRTYVKQRTSEFDNTMHVFVVLVYKVYISSWDIYPAPQELWPCTCTVVICNNHIVTQVTCWYVTSSYK
jgi:hypothetical protein